ncbi:MULTISPECIES: pyridoxal 5'-phosphate synthase glutaminase subunit PdxT [Aneurinibacillus]|uniref:Pyridoxal 5'-phosphate synthase subunit PdxT n=1 Tax=Aneurinibacillus thermoaerophilus TaxID=143495 RepID=A0ABX8YFR6_ANETH|nr:MULTISPECIES: pyridoxal 5'-phosphate synthase glutaminase subunit PdxT [Aneurinibacillus]AMA73140.1 glutamine amidotransferase [Aneurinibacillus sp. XH2]MED0674443.1 pyridoxal 5'-phosphate synthase glutaminase subunit PdxT [Aneurinibacillus thermoaerophilus]MED0678460.1 pyridoxal 5'-phosphate synthase glutaminase subunit PdxT [Aneurinibacillus thermoaerophilus]MED0736016.1 pyridoxal 5'-phosphate synthase glutaminase subunit PdxT [Aneurinibacillus thermoaerophilus]MED0756163.1 pyridoxal 5'-p
MKIGVLALQGAVAEHIRLLEQAGAEAIAVKRVEQLAELDGLVIPGGESTAIGKLMKKYGFDVALKEFSAQKKPLFGTCAGMIILAGEIEGQDWTHLGLMDIKVARNAFGRQRESFETDLPVAGIAEDFRAVFIRAPLIREVGEEVDILARYKDEIVAARQGHLLCASFHPELTDDKRMHAYFLEMVREYRTQEAAVAQ